MLSLHVYESVQLTEIPWLRFFTHSIGIATFGCPPTGMDFIIISTFLEENIKSHLSVKDFCYRMVSLFIGLFQDHG